MTRLIFYALSATSIEHGVARTLKLAIHTSGKFYKLLLHVVIADDISLSSNHAIQHTHVHAGHRQVQPV